LSWIEHVPTTKRLHSHDHRPPVTDNEHHNEVSAYGADGFSGDTNDHWRVEVTDGGGSGKTVVAMRTRFRLIHVNTGCQLFSHNVKLPEWGMLLFT
jgi:dolichyl-phosphate-mannose-protein mannosyltransferase